MVYKAIIVGAGPTGLALSRLMQLQSLSHLVLERAPVVASSWRGLWNNFTLATPMKEIDMLDLNSKGYAPDYKMTRDQAVELFEAFYQRYKLPIKFSVEVTSIRKIGALFEVKVGAEVYWAEHVIICVGPRQYPKYPDRHEKIGNDIYAGRRVLHSSTYKSAPLHFSSHTLVVGSGLSCLQIAEDIFSKNRGKVSIACGRTDAEIWQRNGHIAALKEANPLVKLISKGIEDYGRLLEITEEGGMQFSGKLGITYRKDYFDTIIFATGYVQDFHGLLNELAKTIAPSKDVYNGYGIKSAIDGLFFAGMPPSPGEYTATISAGTQAARDVLSAMQGKPAAPSSIYG